MIVTFLGASVNEYQANYLQFLGRLTFACPICHTVCHWHHWYKRKVADGTAVHSILILRVRCPSCRVTHAILPDFVRPRGRYVNSFSFTTAAAPSGQTMEAEDMTLTNYAVNTNAYASGGELIKLSGSGVTGTAVR